MLKLAKQATFLPVICCILLIYACNPTEQSTAKSTAQPTPDSDPDWTLTLYISGGYAGLIRNISLDQTGRAILVDEKLKSRVETSVTPNDLQMFTKLVKILPSRAAGGSRSTQCRDCITYKLVTNINDTKQQIIADDITLHESSAKELIQKLTRLAAGMAKK